MATITSAASGNFSSASTWVGGVVPSTGDIAVAATGHVITIDTNTTVQQVTQTGTGKFSLAGGLTLTANVEAVAGTTSSGGTVEVTATSGTTATIAGNITGVSTTTLEIAGVVMSGTGTLVVNGNVTGSPGNNASYTTFDNWPCGIFVNTSANVTVNGNLTGGAQGKVAFRGGASASGTIRVNGQISNSSLGANSFGFASLGPNQIIVTGSISSVGGGSGGASTGSPFYVGSSSASVSVTGNLTSGNGNNCYVIWSVGSCPITVVGNVTGGPSGLGNYGILSQGTSGTISVTGNVTAGAGSYAYGINAAGTSSTVSVIGSIAAATALSHGVYCSATTNGVIFQGDVIDHAGGTTAIYCRLVRVTATNSGTTKYANSVGYPNGTLISRVSPDLTTGMPAASNVRKSTVYGYNSELTGTLAVPAAASVAYGIPVDNTTGTAALAPSDVAALVGAQIAAALDSTP